MDREKNKDNPTMIIFRELPASLYRRLDNPNAASIAHMKHRRAATMTSGIEAIKPPTLPASINASRNVIKHLAALRIRQVMEHILQPTTVVNFPK